MTEELTTLSFSFLLLPGAVIAETVLVDKLACYLKPAISLHLHYYFQALAAPAEGKTFYQMKEQSK